MCKWCQTNGVSLQHTSYACCSIRVVMQLLLWAPTSSVTAFSPLLRGAMNYLPNRLSKLHKCNRTHGQYSNATRNVKNERVETTRNDKHERVEDNNNCKTGSVSKTTNGSAQFVIDNISTYRKVKNDDGVQKRGGNMEGT